MLLCGVGIGRIGEMGCAELRLMSGLPDIALHVCIRSPKGPISMSSKRKK
jgi:hypothetical protein